MSKEKDKPAEETTSKLKTEKKSCFIITPIGAINSDINIKARGLIDSVMSPELEKFNFYPLPAYAIRNSGDINNQVLQHILSDELVIANLTGLNPNVMYELAVRHAVRKHVIMMAENPTVLPFDIHNQRTIFYDDSLAGSLKARADLQEAITATLEDTTIDNPIYKATQLKTIINEDTNKDDRTFNQYLIDRLDNIENSISVSNRNTPVISNKIEKNTIQATVVFEYLGNSNNSQFIERKLLEIFHENNLLPLELEIIKPLKKFAMTYEGKSNESNYFISFKQHGDFKFISIIYR